MAVQIPPGGSERRVATQDRSFWLGLMLATVLHAVVIFGIGRSLPTQMGEPEGSLDGISVDLVDAADLMNKSTESLGKPLESDKATQPRQQPKQAARPSEALREPQEATTSSIAEEPLDWEARPDTSGKPSGRVAPRVQPKTRSQLDLSLPSYLPDQSTASLGGSAAVARMPGVTRSGENDEFGRGVIRALRQTMPIPGETIGRVTVRLHLGEDGNLLDVRVVTSSGDAFLDQSVVFAAKQASFPIPPRGSTHGDRTFLVTYIFK